MGSFFTWSREDCESKLDRILINEAFMDRYNEAKATLLYSFKSDHKALLMTTEFQQQQNHFDQPFRFVASWLLHENFNEFMSQVWSHDATCMQNFSSFTEKRTWIGLVELHLTFLGL